MCGSKESRVCAQKQGPFYQLAVKSTGQPHVLSQGEQGWRAFGSHPASPGGQVVRRWEAERLLAQKTHHTSTKGPLRSCSLVCAVEAQCAELNLAQGRWLLLPRRMLGLIELKG